MLTQRDLFLVRPRIVAEPRLCCAGGIRPPGGFRTPGYPSSDRRKYTHVRSRCPRAPHRPRRDPRPVRRLQAPAARPLPGRGQARVRDQHLRAVLRRQGGLTRRASPAPDVTSGEPDTFTTIAVVLIHCGACLARRPPTSRSRTCTSA